MEAIFQRIDSLEVIYFLSPSGLRNATRYWEPGLSGYLVIRGGYLARQITGELVEVSLPGPTHTLPEHPLNDTRWISVKHRLHDWTSAGRLGVGRPKPFVYTSLAKMRLLLTRKGRWIFYNRGVILTIIHWLWWSEPTLAIWSERLAKGPYQKNTPPAVGLDPTILMPASKGRIWRRTFQQPLGRARTPPLISARRVDIEGSVLARAGADSTVPVPCYSVWLALGMVF